MNFNEAFNELYKLYNNTLTEEILDIEDCNTIADYELTHQQIDFFRNSKVRDNNGYGDLIICYHGGPFYFEEFKLNKNKYCKTNTFFFATNYEFAATYAENSESDFHKQKYGRNNIEPSDEFTEGGFVAECLLNCKKIFDYRSDKDLFIINDNSRWMLIGVPDWKDKVLNGSEVKALFKTYDQEELWILLESLICIDNNNSIHILDFIKQHKYDCVVTREYGSIDSVNFIVFDRKNIKFVWNKCPTNSNNMNN